MTARRYRGFGWVLLGLSGPRLEAQVKAVPQVPPLMDAQSEGLRLSLAQAIRGAEANEPAFRALEAEGRALELEKKNARAALLPTAVYHNQVIYTQPNGQHSRIGQVIGATTPVFIANNAIREYASQGVFNETVGLHEIGALRLADANAARTAADAEIARRGLIATVVSLYYTLAAQNTKVLTAQQALVEAKQFVRTTEERELAREVAHADVLKADLQMQQRARELAEMRLAADRAHIELAVLLFADPTTPFQTEGTSQGALPERASVEAAARENNPELRSAQASLRASQADTLLARAAALPELGVNITYGIDAPQVAVNGPEGVRNLGYSGAVTLDIPVWDWLATERRVKESRIRREAASVGLSAAQRRVRADLAEIYDEAAVAQRQLDSLQASVHDSRESLRLTNLRYVDGESTVLEVVDAQNTLTLTEYALADGVVRYQVALAQVQILTGSL